MQCCIVARELWFVGLSTHSAIRKAKRIARMYMLLREYLPGPACGLIIRFLFLSSSEERCTVRAGSRWWRSTATLEAIEESPLFTCSD